MKEIVARIPEATPIRKKLKTAKKPPSFPQERVLDVKAVFNLLPAREVADRCVDLYVNTFETTYRVLHLPSFWKEYDQMWTDADNARPGFIIIVLLMVAAAYCMRDDYSPQLEGMSTVDRNYCCNLVENCEAWIRRQSRKHVDISYVQTHVLLFIAKLAITYKRKRTWQEAGNLKQLAVAMGLHQDTETVNAQNDKKSKKTSVFDQEMRRRLWYTISELELQAGLDRGTPSLLPALAVDCGVPINCEDDEFDYKSHKLPISRPVEWSTRATYLCTMSQSFSLRQEISSVLNSKDEETLARKRIWYTDRILQLSEKGNAWDGRECAFSQSLMSLHLHQLVICLNRRFIKASTDQIHASRFYVAKAAEAIIDIYRRGKIGLHEQRLLVAIRQDLGIAALALCDTRSDGQVRNETSDSCS